MLNQFSRTQLLFGEEGMKQLYQARVAVFGIGGVGGYAVEALARRGIGPLDIIDDDRVCLTNVNRQIFATRKTVGQYKVDVAEARILEINPNAVVHKYKTFYTPQTAEQFDFTQYDYVVDAIDTVTGKLQLVEQAEKAGVPGVVVRRKDYESSEAFDAALLNVLKDNHIDLVVLAGFLSILGPSVIAAYPERILNVHPSLIPSFCGEGFYGLRVHEAALAKGVKVTGATVHFVNEICDGGRILKQKAVEVQPGDTPEILQRRVMEQAEWIILPAAIAEVCEEYDK